jgi:hypothetical protein
MIGFGFIQLLIWLHIPSFPIPQIHSINLIEFPNRIQSVSKSEDPDLAVAFFSRGLSANDSMQVVFLARKPKEKSELVLEPLKKERDAKKGDGEEGRVKKEESTHRPQEEEQQQESQDDQKLGFTPSYRYATAKIKPNPKGGIITNLYHL